MPRYIVERTFPDGLRVPVDAGGAQACGGVVAKNAEKGVTWIHSYVSSDKSRSYCVYDAPDSDAVVQTAQSNGLPVDHITEVRVLDPYFYL